VVVDMSHLDWGSVPVWVATLVTSTSAAVAVISYRRNLYDKEREQASKVSCWVEGGVIFKVTQSHEEIYSATVSVDIKVANRSDSPVYDLEVTLGRSGKTLYGTELPAGVTGTGKMLLPDIHLSKISPGVDQVEARVTIETPTLTFTDALGRRWCKCKGRVRRARPKTQLDATLTAAGSPSPADQVKWAIPQ
jgi:hypothetical protein